MPTQVNFAAITQALCVAASLGCVVFRDTVKPMCLSPPALMCLLPERPQQNTADLPALDTRDARLGGHEVAGPPQLRCFGARSLVDAPP